MEKLEKKDIEASDAQKALASRGLLIIDNVHDMKGLDHVQAELHAILFALKGEATFLLNGQSYTLHENDMLTCSPHDVVSNYKLSTDFQCYCVCMSHNYSQKFIPLVGDMWETISFVHKNPVFPLQPEEIKVVCQYCDLLCSKMKYSLPMQEKTIDTLMQTFIYDIHNILKRATGAAPRQFSSKEFLFQRFVELLTISYPRDRRVYYYAEHLHVTPKYLSAVCKQMVQQIASEVITCFVMRDIEYLMKHSQKSIKEITHELGFPNLSFFGKYVKNRFGLSPKELRKQLLQGN